jgi:hypothetical protein
LTRNIYPLKKKDWVTIDISKEHRKQIHSQKFNKDEPDYITLERASNKIEAIRKKKKRIEVLATTKKS